MNGIRQLITGFIVWWMAMSGVFAEPIDPANGPGTPSNTVSSLGLSLLESPGSIQIITKTEINAMGARDLSDILRAVTAIQFFDKFGYWVEAPMIHGHKSGTRLFVDGKEMTDAAYGLTFAAQCIPIQKIERIEIMTAGAATLKYGARSSGVINVILDKSKTKTMTMATGLMDAVIGSGLTNFTFSDAVFGCEVYLQAAKAENHKSNGKWQEPEGWEEHMFPRFVSEPELFIASVKWNNLEIKGFSQKFMSSALSNWFHFDWTKVVDDEVVNYLYMFSNKEYYTERFLNQGLSINYNHPLITGMDWNTSIHYNYYVSNDLVQVGESQLASNWHTTVKEPVIESEINWQPNDQVDIAFGGKYSRQSIAFDNSIYFNKPAQRPTRFNYELLNALGATPNYATNAQLSCYRAFGALTYRSPLGTLTVGGSADKNSYSAMTLLPHMSVGNTFGPLALKASFQQSFQDMPPRVWQINPPTDSNENPTQEFMTLEGWYQFNSDSSLRLALTNQVNKGFYITHDYQTFSEFSDFRKNGKMTLRFLDAEYAFITQFGQSWLGLSTYLSCSADAGDYPGFVTPAGTPPGAAKLKASFRHVWNAGKQCTLAPTIYYLSDRYALRTAPDDYLKIPACLIVNVNMAYKLSDTLRINAGVFNLTDANEQVADGGLYTPDVLPGASRQVNVSLTLDF